MPRKIDDRIRKLAGDTYAKTDLTLSQIAKKFKVSDRTVQTWSSEDTWELQRSAHQAMNKPQNILEFAPRENPRSIRRAHPEDTLEILNDAISTLYADLGASTGKDAAAIANSLKGLLEYRRKIKPPTVADLVELAIELNVGPDEFLTELRNAWKRKAI